MIAGNVEATHITDWAETHSERRDPRCKMTAAEAAVEEGADEARVEVKGAECHEHKVESHED